MSLIGRKRNSSAAASVLTSSIDAKHDPTCNIYMILGTATETVNIENYVIRTVYGA